MNFSTVPPYRPMMVRAVAKYPLEEFPDVLGITLIRERRETDQVRKQHADMSPLRIGRAVTACSAGR